MSSAFNTARPAYELGNFYNEGRVAYIMGQRPRHCPYDSRVQPQAVKAWIRGNVQEHNDEDDVLTEERKVKR